MSTLVPLSKDELFEIEVALTDRIEMLDGSNRELDGCLVEALRNRIREYRRRA